MGNVPAAYYQGPHDCYPMLATPGEPAPSYSFLITHAPSQTKILFDLGLRKDWETASSPAILRWIRDHNVAVTVEKDVAGILREGGIDPHDIDAVIYSHQHFDHTGDPNTFSNRMKIVVGPGYKQNLFPGWPVNRQSWQTTSDLYQDREVLEITFSDLQQKETFSLGGLQAYDYFGDGSFFLLNSPGHTLAHLSALARTTAPSTQAGQEDESTFMLLGGDIAHSPALFRPTPSRPLPTTVQYPSAETGEVVEVAGEYFLGLHRNFNQDGDHHEAQKSPFCTATGPHHDVKAAQGSMDRLCAFDAMDNIFTVLAHDRSLLRVVDFFPHTANDWRSRGWSRNVDGNF